MAENVKFDRLQPSLLDRLTDSEPNQTRESRDARVIDIRRLREIVQRDLGYLLNTYNNQAIVDAERYPNVARSVLCYGVQETAGDFSTDQKTEMIRKSIKRAIELYEPRIRSGSIEVTAQKGNNDREAIIAFDIRADMWAEPIPMELYLRSEVDVTTGEITVERTA